MAEDLEVQNVRSSLLITQKLGEVRENLSFTQEDETISNQSVKLQQTTDYGGKLNKQRDQCVIKTEKHVQAYSEMYADARRPFIGVAVTDKHTNCGECHLDEEEENGASFNQRLHKWIGFGSNPAPYMIHRGDGVIARQHQDNQYTKK